MSQNNTLIAGLLMIVLAGGLLVFSSVTSMTNEMKMMFTLVFVVFIFAIFGMLVMKK